MIHELAMAQLKAIFILFFSNMEVGVKQLSDDDGDEYGIWLKHQWSQNILEDIMSNYDPDWVIWRIKDEWGVTWHEGNGNPENSVEREHAFEVKLWHEALDKLFSLLKDQFMDDLRQMEHEYLNDD